jgi:hypothetical protein
MEQFPAERRLTTVDIDRRGYGRRYTWLPVDSLSREGFVIDCTGAYMQPERFDLQLGDTVRWLDGGRLLEASIIDVQRDEMILRVAVGEATLLPPDFFAP